MSNRRRPTRNNRVRRHDDAQSVLFEVGSDAEYDSVQAQLEKLMSGAGVPPDTMAKVLSSRDPDEAIQLLVDGGHLPTQDDLAAGMLEGFEPLLKSGTTALDAEILGAEFLGMMSTAAADPDDVPALLADLIPMAEASGKPEALAMLRVLAAIGSDQARHVAAAAADRMAAGGVKDCRWVDDLGSAQVIDCFGYSDGLQEAIALTFAYGRRRHAVCALIDHGLGGGVKDCFLADRTDGLRAQYQKAARRFGLDFHDHAPSAARAILDEALRQPPCPVTPDQVEDVRSYLGLLRRRVALLAEAAPSAPPAARTAGGCTVYRIKVSLRGARPPIWRRLEVPSTITLPALHRAIQNSFAWQDYHLWVFETAAGTYGQSDPELGHRSAAGKKLQSVAPRAGDRFTYTYDFGDGWEHDILVEDVLDAEPGVAYPRCVTGRGAGPPEDCGGIWGYAELLAILADPDHEEHDNRLEWLGLESADDFDPGAFDAEAVNKALSRTARVLVKSP